ncbi:MAG: hypothetical protein IJN84_04315 [Clostridia bacterium]|nr:hypothetical protein [Clostridia bacterium]
MKKKLVWFIIPLLILAFAFSAWHFMPKNTKINTKGWIYRTLGIDIIKGDEPKYDVIRLKDDYITFAGTAEDITPFSNKLNAFGTWLENNDIPFLYVQAPHKWPKNMVAFPNQKSHYAQQADDMLSSLSNNGLDTYDMRDDIDGLEYFFKTDHHWKPETGLSAARYIAEILNEKYNFELDIAIYDESNFTFEVKENFFLGSQGKKVGKYYAGLDDYTIITPKFETDLQKTVPIMGIDIKGDFADCFHDYSVFDNQDIFTASPYVFYTSDYNLEIDRNNLVDNDKKVLFIRDSFGCVLTPFLSLSINELHVVDTRFFKENLYDYILQNDFDLVIFESNPGFNQAQFTLFKEDILD